MELNCGSHMVLLSTTAVIVNKMQRSPSRGGWEGAGLLGHHSLTQTRKDLARKKRGVWPEFLPRIVHSPSHNQATQS